MSLEASITLSLGTLDLDVELIAPAGTVLAVLGPNGSGKTTILRAIAGLEPLQAGHVRVAQRVLDDPATATLVPPEQRRVALVHQDFVLFPHLSVLDNVAFGARSAGASKAASRRAAEPWLDRVGLASYTAARPAELSGGQAQRVALARALAAEPDVLLLDEPLASLDVATRAATRRDLRSHLDGYQGTTVLVTHDPLDVLMLADHVAILDQGRITQAGSLAEVTTHPRTRYVADLIGTNLLRGSADGATVRCDEAVVAVADYVAPGDTFLTIPPSAITLHLVRPEGSARNVWPVAITAIDPLGSRMRVHLDGPLPLVAEITPAAVAELGLQVDAHVWASAKATEITTYPA